MLEWLGSLCCAGVIVVDDGFDVVSGGFDVDVFGGGA